METTAKTRKSASFVKLDELTKKIDRLTMAVESQSVTISQLQNRLLHVANMLEYQNLPQGQSQTPRPGFNSYPKPLGPNVFPFQPQFPFYPQKPFQQPMQPVKKPAVSPNPYMSHGCGGIPNLASLLRVDIDAIIESLMKDATKYRLCEFDVFTGENENEVCIQVSNFAARGAGQDGKTAAIRINDFMCLRPDIDRRNVVLYVVNPVYAALSGQRPDTQFIVTGYQDLITALTVKL